LFWLFATAAKLRFHQMMAPRFPTILTGGNLPKIRQAREPEPSIINEKTVADFTRVEQTGILERDTPDHLECTTPPSLK
jgi:hypothetical protein